MSGGSSSGVTIYKNSTACPYKCNHSALQRQNTEISKQIFPEKEYRGLSPNFPIHVSVRDLYEYIPTTGLPILLEEIMYVD
jgi:hypothetical protein